MTGTSPPGPFRCGSTTCRVNAVATAASKALPPFSRVAMPTAVAIQWVDVTTPKVPSISGRVVNGLGLIFFIEDLGAIGSPINHSLGAQPTRRARFSSSLAGKAILANPVPGLAAAATGRRSQARRRRGCPAHARWIARIAVRDPRLRVTESSCAEPRGSSRRRVAELLVAAIPEILIEAPALDLRE